MISSVPGIVSLSGGWLSLLEEVEDDETGDSAQEFSAKLTEEGVANRRSRQSVAVTAIVNIFSWQHIEQKDHIVWCNK